MAIDWTKPIRFRSGERCRLYETWLGGSPNFPDCTRIIQRLDVDTSTMGGAMTSLWWLPESGETHWKEGFTLENEDRELSEDEAEFLRKANVDQTPLYPKPAK